MIDIEKENDILGYLKEKKLIEADNSLQIKRFGGGVSCKVIQIKTKNSSFVIKQALSKLRVKDNWYSDRSRIITERKCLATYYKIVPEYVPKVLYYDDSNYLFVMESASSESIPWKSLLLNGKIDYHVGEKVASALARVHEVSSRDYLIKKQFKNDNFFIELRIEPYLETIKDRHPALDQYIQDAIDYLLNQFEVSGDIPHLQFKAASILSGYYTTLIELGNKLQHPRCCHKTKTQPVSHIKQLHGLPVVSKFQPPPANRDNPQVSVL